MTLGTFGVLADIGVDHHPHPESVAHQGRKLTIQAGFVAVANVIVLIVGKSPDLAYSDAGQQ